MKRSAAVLRTVVFLFKTGKIDAQIIGEIGSEDIRYFSSIHLISAENLSAAFTRRQDISNEELDEVQRMIDRIRKGG